LSDLDKDSKYDRLDKVLEKSSDHLFNNAELDELSQELGEIYRDGFRHQYNRIFNILSMLDKNDSSRIDTVAGNIRAIYEKIQDSESHGEIAQQVGKLYDHVKLGSIENTIYTQYQPALDITRGRSV